MYVASEGGNTLHGLTSRRKCGAFIVRSGINKHFSILAPINLLPVTITNCSVRRLITNTHHVCRLYTRSITFRGGVTVHCTTMHCTLCRSNGGVRLLTGFTPGLRCITR